MPVRGVGLAQLLQIYSSEGAMARSPVERARARRPPSDGQRSDGPSALGFESLLACWLLAEAAGDSRAVGILKRGAGRARADQYFLLVKNREK